MVAVGWWGRQLFQFLILVSGKYDLRGRFAPHYVNPEWLAGEWGLRDGDCQESMTAVKTIDASLRDLEREGILVRDGDVLVIEKWDEFYGKHEASSTPRVRKHRAALAEARQIAEVPAGTEAAPVENGVKQETPHNPHDMTEHDTTAPDVSGEVSWNGMSLAKTWNTWAHAAGLARVTKLGGDRERHANARAAEYTHRQVELALDRLIQSDFLLGKAPSGPVHAGWKADFDWFIRPMSIARILEGKYDNRGPGPSGARKLGDDEDLYK